MDHLRLPVAVSQILRLFVLDHFERLLGAILDAGEAVLAETADRFGHYSRVSSVPLVDVVDAEGLASAAV
jgi:hypothetical protein